MKNIKGFTLVEVIASFAILSILLAIGIVSYQYIVKKAELTYYKTLEQELLLAGGDYFNDNRIDKPLSGFSQVDIETLVGDKYIEALKDKNGKVCNLMNESKVYIIKNDSGYDYEACLVCNDYETSGNYCGTLIENEVNISAKKDDGTTYNTLLSYNSTKWSNSNITITFSMTEPITHYLVKDNHNNTETTCNDIDNNSCTMTISTTSNYTVTAYNDDTVVGNKKEFNVKIDKEAPSCEFSGPIKAYIKGGATDTYEMICTDNVGIDNLNLTVNSFTLGTQDIVVLDTINTVNENNSYKSTITVIGDKSGVTNLKLNSGSVKDSAGNSNATITSNDIKVDATSPSINYSLASGTYNTNQTIIVTVTDNMGIKEIEYSLYKDEQLFESDNLTGDSNTTISFDVDLDGNGIWELLIKAHDEVGNYNNNQVNAEGYYSQKYTLETGCKWVAAVVDTDTSCLASSETEGVTSYISCEYVGVLYRYNRMYQPKDNPTNVGQESCYISSWKNNPSYEWFTSSSAALTACENQYCSGKAPSAYYWYCRIYEDNVYRKIENTYVCE